MISQFVFKVGKMTVQCIGGVRYSQVRVVLKSKEVRQVPFKAQIRASQTFMRINFALVTRCSLIQKIAPFQIPAFQEFCK